MKRLCIKCGKEKDLSLMVTNKRSTHGVMRRCKDCDNKLSRKRDWKNRGYVKILDKRRFDGQRESVIKRDGERCMKCGMTRSEHKTHYGRDITVHHKDGKGYYSKIKNNKMRNMITLCLSCHGKIDNKRRFTHHDGR